MDFKIILSFSCSSKLLLWGFFLPFTECLIQPESCYEKIPKGSVMESFSSLISLLTLFPSFLPSPPCGLDPQPIDVKGKSHTDLMRLWIRLPFLGHLFL